MRQLDITRQEAEDLVDLLEENSSGRQDRFAMADDIRREWGMAPCSKLKRSEFRLGEHVSKVGGDYRFDGTVIGVFTKLSGVVRYAVEDDRGVLHIYSAKNLKRREEAK